MSIRERRRARIDEARENESPEIAEAIVETEPKKEPVMSTAAPALQERPDEKIDLLIDNSNFGPSYEVIYSVTKKNGNTWPGVRQFRGPLIGAKDVGRACSELVAGGGVFRVEVSHDVENGNKKALLPKWLEAYEGPPFVGEPHKSLTLGWDAGAGDVAGGEWVTQQRPGTATAPMGAPSGSFGGGFGQVAALQSGGGWQQPTRDAMGNILPPPPSLGLPASVRSYPVQDQWLAAQQMWTQKLGFRPSLEPVDVAMKWLDSRGQEQDRLHAHAARLEERVESQRDRNTQALESERKRNQELERRIAEIERKNEQALAEARQAARDAKYDAQIEALKTARPVESPRSPLADFAPFVPVLASLVTVWGQNQQAQAQAQQNFLLTVMKPKDPPALPPPPPTLAEQIIPLLTAVSPLLIPVFTQWMHNQSPEAQAQLREQSQLSGQGMIQMMMEFIKYTNQGDPEPPWWQEPLMNAITMASGGVNAMMLKAAQQPPLLQEPKQPEVIRAEVRETTSTKRPRAQTEGPVQEAAIVNQEPPPPIVAPIADLESLLAKFGELDRKAADETLFIMRQIAMMAQAGRLDARLVTHEWASLLFAIHQTQPSKNDVRDLAQRVADHVEHCRAFSLLPENFAPLFEKPHETLWEFMHRMPIALGDLERAKEITTAIANEIELRETERKRALSEIDDASGEVEVGEEPDDEEDDGDEEEDEDESGDEAAEGTA